MNLKNKKILITAGPTWVPIDRVRVISNIATGETGILLAEELNKLGARVTLLFGPLGSCRPGRKIRLLHFKFFDDLKDIMKKELRSGKYDIVIQTAAVSDYKPARVCRRKIHSGIPNWTLRLIPTQKIIGLIKKIDSSLFVVGFKFEPQAKKRLLIEKAKELLGRSSLDLVVANTVAMNKYLAYIIDSNKKTCGPFLSKKDMAAQLVNKIKEHM